MAELKQIIEVMNKKPYLMNMGAGSLARIFKTTREVIYKAKDTVRNNSVNTIIPKILILDIETTPLEAYVWQMQVWKARISDDNIISQWFMLTWAAKWLGSNEIFSMRLTGKEAVAENDKRIVQGLWDLLNQADIVIAHNGDSFDVPNINTRFIVNGLPPTKAYRTIDTLKIARKQFGFTHNSLNALGKLFKLGAKIETDFDLWRRSKNGSDEALEEMRIYNEGDVELLENVYIKLRPYIKGHPNLGVYSMNEEMQCGHCGSTHLVQEDSFLYTNVGKYRTYRCSDCGAVSKGRKSVITKDKSQTLITTIQN